MVPSKEQVQTVSTCLQPSLAAEKNELYQASVPYEFSMLIFSLPPLKFEMGLRAASALDSSQNSLHHQGCANVMTTGTLAGEKKNNSRNYILHRMYRWQCSSQQYQNCLKDSRRLPGDADIAVTDR